MIFLRKFHDPAVAEPATQVAEQPVQSIAQMMATQGTFNSSGNMAATPLSISEKKEEPTSVSEEVPAATATTTSNPETANQESQSPVKEPEAVQSAQIAPEPTKVPTWQEVLKSQQSDTVLKALGFDDKTVKLAKEIQENPKMISLYNHWKEKGDVTAYLRELTTDYTKMPAEEVMRHQLRQEYPKASDAALNAIFKNEIVKAYKLDSDEPEEVEEGRLLLEAKADKFRDSFIQNQEKFLLPPAPEAKDSLGEYIEQQNQERSQRDEVYKSQLVESPFFKNIVSSKQISIGEGAEKFNFPVDAQQIMETLTDTRKFAESLFDIKQENGKTILNPKIEKQLLVGTFMNDPYKFLSDYAKHFKSLGGQAAIEPIQNATLPNNNTASVSEAAPKNAAEAMARQGRINSGGY